MRNIGLHIIGDFFNPAGLVSPGGVPPLAVKILDPSAAFVRQVRSAVGENCLVVVRFYEREQSLAAPRTAAREWFARHVSAMLTMNDPNVAFEGYNEIVDSQAKEYAEFEVERLRLMHGAGLRTVVGNWSVGTPDIPAWQIYRPVLEAMRPGDFVGLHEYWADAGTLRNSWFCGRWQHVPELAGRAIIVTECGRDRVANVGGGWKGQISAEAYLEELREYSRLLGDRVFAATVFTGGNVSGWESYDVNALWKDVVALYDGDVAPAPPATPVPGRIRLRRYLSHWDRWQVTARFGEPGDRWAGGVHKGADLVRADGGTDGAAIFAPFDGVIDVNSWRADRGWYLYLYDEAQRVEFFVCHLREQSRWPSGARVRAGEYLGAVGATGRTTGPHLHVGVCRVDPATLEIKEWVDPFGNQVNIVD